MAREYGKTIIIVTHNQNIAKMADVVIHIRSGKVTSVNEQLHPLSAEEVDEEVVAIYALSGVRVYKPSHGVFIYKYKNGTSRKVVVK